MPRSRLRFDFTAVLGLLTITLGLTQGQPSHAAAAASLEQDLFRRQVDLGERARKIVQSLSATETGGTSATERAQFTTDLARYREDFEKFNAANSSSQIRAEVLSSLEQLALMELRLNLSTGGANLESLQKRSALKLSQLSLAGVKLPASFASEPIGTQQVQLALSDAAILRADIQRQISEVTENSYPQLARCLIGAALSRKYAHTLLHQPMVLAGAWQSRLENLSKEPICLGASFARLVSGAVREQLSEQRSQRLGTVALSALPVIDKVFPPDLIEQIKQAEKAEFKVFGGSATLGQDLDLLILRPEITQGADASIEEIKKRLSTLQLGRLFETAGFFITADLELVRDILSGINSTRPGLKITLTPTELLRRLQINQIVSLSARLLEAPDYFSTVTSAEGINQAFAQFMTGAVQVSIRLTIERLIHTLTKDQEPLDLATTNKLNAALNSAIERHFKRLDKSNGYAQFRDRVVRTLVEASSVSSIVSGNETLAKRRLVRAAKEAADLVGAKIQDEDLIYSMSSAMAMLDYEIKKSSPRVQEWFEMLKAEGQFAPALTRLQAIDAHMGKMADLKLCQPEPLTTKKKWTQGALAGAKAFFGLSNEAGISVGAKQDLEDCRRFTLLSQFTGLRGAGQDAPQDMRQIVANIDLYLGKQNREILLKTYRNFQRAQIMDRNHLLQWINDESGRPLFEALAQGEGAGALEKAAPLVLKNLEDSFKRLAMAKSLSELAPWIVNTDLLDAAFGGHLSTTKPENPTLDLEVRLRSLKKVIQARAAIRSTETVLAARNSTAAADQDLYSLGSALRVHELITSRLRAAHRGQQDHWRAVSTDAFSLILPIVGLTAYRWLSVFRSPGSPQLLPNRILFDYMAVNSGLAKGYFTLLTPVFITDAFTQHFSILADAEENKNLAQNQFLTELFSDDPSLISFSRAMDLEAQFSARADQARFQRNWSAAVTLGPWVIQAAAPVAYRLAQGIFVRYYARYDQVLKNLFTGDRRLFASEVERLDRWAERRLLRLANRYRLELATLGIKWDGTLVRDRLQPKFLLETAAAAAKNAENAGRLSEAAAITYAYRRLISALFEETRALQNMTQTYSREIYARSYFGPQASAADLQVIRDEFRRLFLPTSGGRP